MVFELLDLALNPIRMGPSDGGEVLVDLATLRLETDGLLVLPPPLLPAPTVDTGGGWLGVLLSVVVVAVWVEVSLTMIVFPPRLNIRKTIVDLLSIYVMSTMVDKEPLSKKMEFLSDSLGSVLDSD